MLVKTANGSVKITAIKNFIIIFCWPEGVNKFKQNFHIIRQVDTNCLASKPTLNGNKWPQKFGVFIFFI